jgi:hypothetical protein
LKLSKVLDVVGRSMTIDAGGIGIDDWMYAMREVTADTLLTIKTNNGTFHASEQNQGAEALDDTTLTLLKAVVDDTVGTFLTAHPELVTSS